jgi:hypothetical protein
MTLPRRPRINSEMTIHSKVSTRLLGMSKRKSEQRKTTEDDEDDDVLLLTMFMV